MKAATASSDMVGMRETGAGIRESGASRRADVDLERVPPRDRERESSLPGGSINNHHQRTKPGRPGDFEGLPGPARITCEAKNQ